MLDSNDSAPFVKTWHGTKITNGIGDKHLTVCGSSSWEFVGKAMVETFSTIATFDKSEELDVGEIVESWWCEPGICHSFMFFIDAEIYLPIADFRCG